MLCLHNLSVQSGLGLFTALKLCQETRFVGHIVGGSEGMSYIVCVARLGLADTIWGLFGLSLAVPLAIFILELLPWLSPHWKVYVGCGWGPRVFFTVRFQSFEVHPTESSKPLRRRVLWRDQSRAKMDFC